MVHFHTNLDDQSPNLSLFSYLVRRTGGATGSVGAGDGDWRAHATDNDFVLEAWSEGYMVGSLVIMAAITIANMRKGVLLHKLILAEQLLALTHGTFCFMSFNGYGWYLSSTAALLYCSWVVHNVVAWMKIRPFFNDPRSIFKRNTGKWVTRIYLSTLACTVPPIILQIYDNFRFFNDINDLYKSVRPYEPLMRDPWWIFTCIVLFHVIRKCYGTGFVELIKRAPRFGILLVSIVLSLTFTGLDIAASIHNFIGTTDGINPWWKLSLVFKCLTDTIMLDDFKTELKKLGVKRIQQAEMRRNSVALVDNSKLDPFSDDSYSSAESPNHVEITNPAALRRQTLDSGQGVMPRAGMRQESAISNELNMIDALNDTEVASPPPVAKKGAKIPKLHALNSFWSHGGKSAKTRDEQEEKKNKPAGNSERSNDANVDVERQDSAEDTRGPSPHDANERLAAMRASLGIIDYRPNPRATKSHPF